ncbi:GGDEF domain-containing protein [Pseudoalteromonas luteoviolacea]|uniref:GGDEF domain-containing protein n=1 Tax=Pseudoalteromonas luteoviolacea TaxID=43657 RepID=UPI001B39FBC9|nr:GGDEF domain-containing protein [Pseudoalteromonas luteoviolacea]MBQ4879083.1 GGDEF domain-containing protein [Pseudoalteromonas luteoviolacea]MBQ4908162.1 GGDEF domain-containing protein [Pseudoalteromonas luteoviolacea]
MAHFITSIKHLHLWALLIVSVTITILMAIHFGELKPYAQFEILDAIGEGGLAAMSLVWLVATLLSRPQGRVTTALSFGLTLMLISLLLDCLDEFFSFNHIHPTLSSLEAFPALLGMIVMSIAMYWWYQEQTFLNLTLLRKERHFREHTFTDYVTGLYSARYMEKQIDAEVSQLIDDGTRFCVAILDLKAYSQFCFEHGITKGELLLRDTGQLITLNIRGCDLTCRYAGDKFIVLYPATKLSTAIDVTNRVCTAAKVHHQYDKNLVTLNPSTLHYACIEVSLAMQSEQIFEQLMAQLAHNKQAC